MNPEQPSVDYEKPVAYDAEGRPLYAHPLTNQPVRADRTQAVHMMRPVDPERLVVSDAVKLKHDRSTRIFPSLNLSEGEYVIDSIRRHQIGLFLPVVFGVTMVAMALTLLFNFDLVLKYAPVNIPPIDSSEILFPVFTFIMLAVIGTYAAYYVYTNNKFYLTNESVIQEIQTSIFSRREQTVSLVDIEDVSYTQVGIIQQLFNFGSIRLSTEGDETTYRFTYVANPKTAVATLNNAVEAFKNGRAIC